MSGPRWLPSRTPPGICRAVKGDKGCKAPVAYRMIITGQDDRTRYAFACGEHTAEARLRYPECIHEIRSWRP